MKKDIRRDQQLNFYLAENKGQNRAILLIQQTGSNNPFGYQIKLYQLPFLRKQFEINVNSLALWRRFL